MVQAARWYYYHRSRQPARLPRHVLYRRQMQTVRTTKRVQQFATLIVQRQPATRLLRMTSTPMVGTCRRGLRTMTSTTKMRHEGKYSSGTTEAAVEAEDLANKAPVFQDADRNTPGDQDEAVTREIAENTACRYQHRRRRVRSYGRQGDLLLFNAWRARRRLVPSWAT